MPASVCVAGEKRIPGLHPRSAIHGCERELSPLEVVDSRLLRRHLEQVVSRNRLTRAKSGLAELRRALAGAAPAMTVTAAAPPADSAKVAGEAAAEVVTLEQVKARRRRPRASAGLIARLGAAMLAMTAGVLLTMGPRHAHDMIAEASSQAGAQVLGIACTMLGCRVVVGHPVNPDDL